MKWFRVDSDTPNHPATRRVIRRLGNAGFGALVRLWCFTAQFGRGDPGWCVDSTNTPIPAEDLMDACDVSAEELGALLEICAEVGLIDAEAWANRACVIFPGMLKRSSDYRKYIYKHKTRSEDTKTPRKKTPRKNQKNTDTDAPSVDRAENDQPTVQDSTVQDITEGSITGEAAWEAAEAARKLWNDHTQLPIPRCSRLSQERVERLAGLMQTYGAEALAGLFQRVQRSGFCSGQNETGWTATIDWMIKPGVALKVEEGNYDTAQAAKRAGLVRSTKAGKYDAVEVSDGTLGNG